MKLLVLITFTLFSTLPVAFGNDDDDDATSLVGPDNNPSFQYHWVPVGGDPNVEIDIDKVKKDEGKLAFPGSSYNLNIMGEPPAAAGVNVNPSECAFIDIGATKKKYDKATDIQKKVIEDQLCDDLYKDITGKVRKNAEKDNKIADNDDELTPEYRNYNVPSVTPSPAFDNIEIWGKKTPSMTKKCFKGNDLFKSHCNAFDGNQVLSDNKILSIGSAFVFASSDVLKMNSDTDCDECMAKVHSVFSDSNSLNDDKDKAKEKLFKRLKAKSVAPSMLMLSGVMEKAFALNAMYKKSIDKNLSALPESDREQMEKELFCMDSASIEAEIELECAASEFSADEAKTLLREGLEKMDLGKGGLDAGLKELAQKVVTRKDNNCDNGKSSFSDYKVKDFLSYRQVERITPEKASTLKVYSFIENSLKKDIDFKNNCAKYKNGEETRSSRPELFLRHKINLTNNQPSGPTGKIYFDISKEFSSDVEGVSLSQSFRVELMRATRYDANLAAMLNSWETLCSVQEGLDDDVKLVDLARGKEPNDSDEFHKAQFDKLKNYSKVECGRSYKKLARQLCGKQESFGKFASYDFLRESEEIFKELESDVKSNQGNIREIQAQMVALGAVRCASGVKDSLESPELIKSDPLRRISRQILTPSSFAIMEAKEKLIVGEPGVVSRGFHAESDDGLCSEINNEMREQTLAKMIYGDEIDSEVALNFYKDNINSFSGSEYEDFNETMANTYFPNDQELRKKIDSFKDPSSGSRNIASTAGDNGTSAPGTFTKGSSYDVNNSDFQPVTPQGKTFENDLNQKAMQALGGLEDAKSESDVNEIAKAWEKEKADYLKKIADLENSINKKIENPSDLPKSGEGSIADLEKQLADLEKNKKSLIAKDNMIKEAQKLTKEKSSIDGKVAEGSFGTKEDVGSGSRGLAAGANGSATGGGFTPSPGFTNTGRIPKSDFKKGVGGYIYTQSPEDAVLRLSTASNLEELQTQIENGEIQIDFIKVGGEPKFIKIEGETNYIPYSKFRELVMGNEKLSFLRKYLTGEDLAAIEKLANEKSEVMLASVEEATNPSAKLVEMRAALEFSKMQMACLKHKDESGSRSLANVDTKYLVKAQCE